MSCLFTASAPTCWVPKRWRAPYQDPPCSPVSESLLIISIQICERLRPRASDSLEARTDLARALIYLYQYTESLDIYWPQPRPSAVEGAAMSAMVYAKAYLPLATRTNSGDVPTEWEASTQLTEFAETLSPSDASTAAWTCATRIGPAWSAITSRTASSTQAGRRACSLRLVMARGRAPLALNQPTSWPGDSTPTEPLAPQRRQKLRHNLADRARILAPILSARLRLNVATRTSMLVRVRSGRPHP
jgi:hypothetical protein